MVIFRVYVNLPESISLGYYPKKTQQSWGLLLDHILSTILDVDEQFMTNLLIILQRRTMKETPKRTETYRHCPWFAAIFPLYYPLIYIFLYLLIYLSIYFSIDLSIYLTN